mgnify:CR=1 FL=1
MTNLRHSITLPDFRKIGFLFDRSVCIRVSAYPHRIGILALLECQVVCDAEFSHVTLHTMISGVMIVPANRPGMIRGAILPRPRRVRRHRLVAMIPINETEIDARMRVGRAIRNPLRVDEPLEFR